jgi:hypothetical protein
MTKYIALVLALMLALAVSIAGVFAYRYKDAQAMLDSALEANKLYAAAIDRLTKQRKLDDAAVSALQKGIAALDAQAELDAQAREALQNDPTAKEFLDRPVPASVKRLLTHSK